MPIAQVHPLQIVEHRFSTAVVDLIVQRLEVSPISPISGADSERSVASLIASCRNDPAGFGEHYDVHRLRTSNASIPLRSMVSLGSVIIACSRPTQRLSPPQ